MSNPCIKVANKMKNDASDSILLQLKSCSPNILFLCKYYFTLTKLSKTFIHLHIKK